MHFTFKNDADEYFLMILREVGTWLSENGKVLWEVETLTAENLITDLTRGNAHVMYADGVPAAAFILQWVDPLYFLEVPAGTAGIIHKLAIRRAYAGQNLFRSILDYCKAECLKKGIHEIQLETDSARPKLMAFYERSGFTPGHQKDMQEFGQKFRCQFYKMEF